MEQTNDSDITCVVCGQVIGIKAGEHDHTICIDCRIGLALEGLTAVIEVADMVPDNDKIKLATALGTAIVLILQGQSGIAEVRLV